MRTGALAKRGKSAAQSAITGVAPEIADYELLRPVGRGSYGIVWLAQNVVGAYRAVKIIERKAFRSAEPFEREFQGITRFEPVSRTHPGLVNVLHIGRGPERSFYYVMEAADDLLSGQAIDPANYSPRTLDREAAKRGKVPLGECVQLGLQLAGALAHLHSHGLVHRDIKPSNVIFVNDVPKLADIGLVSEISESSSALGTQGYMAPEGPGSRAADIFSLGKVLYAISTGLDGQCFPELPLDPGGCDAEFPAFNQVLLRACAWAPAMRFESAEAMHRALRECQSTRGPRVSASERRFVTALALNISTTAAIDPEEQEHLMNSSYEAARKTVQEFEGAVTQYMSDGLIAVFGAPVACEDHAQRAVRCALAMRDAVVQRPQGSKGRPPAGFSVRIGLHSGLALVGRNASTAGCSATGDVINLASRIAGLAEANQVIITGEAVKGLADYIIVKSLGEHTVLGRDTPVELCAINGFKEARSRIDAGVQRGLTPLVGRSQELATLHERFAKARQGRGQLVLLSGDPGVGKSRLLLEFRRSLAGAEAGWFRGHAISYGRQLAYRPIIELLRNVLGIDERDNEATASRGIEAQLGVMGRHAAAAAPYIKFLLSVNPGNQSVVRMDAPERRTKTVAVLLRLFSSLAEQRPLILVIEDLHWIDRTSEDFLFSLAESLGKARVLLVLTHRPEYADKFPEHPQVTRLALQQLTEGEMVEMTRKLLAGKEPPAALLPIIRSRAEGNPFFLEEMIKSLLETGSLHRRGGGYSLAPAAGGIRVPTTLQDVIMGRIDRLAPAAKHVLQLASVIGREFSIGLLGSITDAATPLDQALRRLEQLELIFERSPAPERTCLFKHALTQEVAYNSLLRQHRKELHCLVAATVEELYPGRLPEFYGVLAFHYELGEDWTRALEYLLRAAERSHRIAASREEALLLSRAIAIAERLGDQALVTELRGRRGPAWVRAGAWSEAAPDMKAALEELPAENKARRAELLLELAGAHFWDLNVRGMQRCAAAGRTLAKDAGRTDLEAGMTGWLALGQVSDGKLDAAIQLFETAFDRDRQFCCASMAGYPLALYLRGRIREAIASGREIARRCELISDPFAATFGRAHLGLALAAAGLYRDASRVFDEARHLAVKYENRTFQARSMAMAAGFHMDVFDFTGHEILAQEALDLARSGAFEAAAVSTSLDLAFNWIRRGEAARAGPFLVEATEAIKRTGGWHRWLWELRLKQAMAELELARGKWRQAAQLAQASMALSRSRGRVKYETAALETLALALVQLGRKKQAIGCLRNAVALAQTAGDPAMILRAASALLPIAGDDALASDARAAARRIIAQLPKAEMRRRFADAPQVRLLGERRIC